MTVQRILNNALGKGKEVQPQRGCGVVSVLFGEGREGAGGKVLKRRESVNEKTENKRDLNFSNMIVQRILNNAPEGEEEILRKMGCHELLQFGVTNALRGGYSFALGVEKFKEVESGLRFTLKEKEVGSNSGIVEI